MIFVTVGSQKFQFNRLLKKIDELVEKNIINDEVFAQVGVSTYKPQNYKYVDFLSQEEFKKKVIDCDLIITHAGTGVIVNAIKMGKKVIGIPRLKIYGEHVDDHQIQLIEQFEKLNYIEGCYDIDYLENSIIKAKEKSYDIYVSKNQEIIKSIEEFIDC